MFLKFLPKDKNIQIENSFYVVREIGNINKIKVVKKGEDPFYVSDKGKVSSLENIPVNKDRVDFLLNFFRKIGYFHKFYPKEKLQSYGLNDPIFVFYVEGEKGRFSLKIGNKTHDGEYYYAILEGLNENGEVLTIGSGNIEQILSSKKDYIELKLIKHFEKTFGEDGKYNGDGVQNCVVRGENSKDFLEFGVDEKGEIYVKHPKDFKLDEKVKEIIEKGPNSLVAKEAVVLNPTEKELEDFGLKAPSKTIEYEIDNRKYKIRIGKVFKVEQNPVSEAEEKKEVETVKYYYVLVEGVSCVFSVREDFLPWLKLK